MPAPRSYPPPYPSKYSILEPKSLCQVDLFFERIAGRPKSNFQQWNGATDFVFSAIVVRITRLACLRCTCCRTIWSTSTRLRICSSRLKSAATMGNNLFSHVLSRVQWNDRRFALQEKPAAFRADFGERVKTCRAIGVALCRPPIGVIHR